MCQWTISSQWQREERANFATCADRSSSSYDSENDSLDERSPLPNSSIRCSSVNFVRWNCWGICFTNAERNGLGRAVLEGTSNDNLVGGYFAEFALIVLGADEKEQLSVVFAHE